MPDHGADGAERRRSPDSHAAILDATVSVLEELGYRALTIEGVSRRAGVGKQTIYRWWGGSKADLVLEAFIGVSDTRVPPPDTGSVRGDLEAIMIPVFRLHADRGKGTALANRTLMAEAQLDDSFHDRYAGLHRHWHGPMLEAVRRGMARGEVDPATDAQAVVDALLGAAWYRLMVGHAPLDESAARAFVGLVLDGCRA